MTDSFVARLKRIQSTATYGRVIRKELTAIPSTPAMAARDQSANKPAWILDVPDSPQPWSPAGAERKGAVATDVESLYDNVVEEARVEGHAAGFEAGRQEALAQGTAELDAERAALAEARQALEAELAELAATRRQLAYEAEAALVELALQVGTSLAVDTLKEQTDWVAPLVQQAVAALTEHDDVTCAISPELARRLSAEERAELGALTVDPDLGELDVRVESRFGQVDATFNGRLAQIRESVREAVETSREAGARANATGAHPTITKAND